MRRPAPPAQRLRLAWPLLAAALQAPVVQAAPAATPRLLQASEPRAFGWFLGDEIEREAWLSLPAGWHLLPASLPTPRDNGAALELRNLRVVPQGGALQLLLRYQVMRSPAQARSLEMPPLKLQLAGPGGAEQTVRVEAWPVLVAPLAPEVAPTRRGLGPLRPDRPPPPAEDPSRPLRLALEAAVALGALASLARARWGAWWRRGQQRPLAAAFQQLQALPAEASLPAQQQALRGLHHALNRTAGQVLAASGLPAFCQQRPAFAPHALALQQLFAQSDRLFFAGQPLPPEAWQAVRQLARALRVAERQT